MQIVLINSAICTIFLLLNMKLLLKTVQILNSSGYQQKSKKDELFDLLIANGCDYTLLAQKYGVGVSSKNYQDTFARTHKDVKRLEKKEF